MRIEFDPEKLAANVAKHGVWFAQAEGFEWASALVRCDNRRHYGETRFEATGLIGARLYVLVFTLRETALRVISLRKANTREIKRYVQQISDTA